MVHRFQESDNYDDYDPVPYQGGYDQEAAYGSVKPADEESGYRRADFGEDEEEQEVEYGNESNPYGRGHPGASIYGGHPTPGGVYGGGRDRTQAYPDEAQPDEGGEVGYGRRRPEYEAEEEQQQQSGYGQSRYEQTEEGGYGRRKYGEEEASEEGGYGRRKYGDEDPDESGYGGGYGRQKRDDYDEGGEEGGYRARRNDDEEEPQEKKSWW